MRINGSYALQRSESIKLTRRRFLQLVTHLTGATVGSSIRSFPAIWSENMRRLAIYAVALVVLALPFPAGSQGVITTVTGTDWVFRSEGQPGVDAPLGLVAGVAVDSAGNLYLTDVGNHRVFKVSASGTLTILAGNGIQWFSGDRRTGQQRFDRTARRRGGGRGRQRVYC